MDSVELVSYKEMDYIDLELLDKKSIVREIDKEEVVSEKKKPIFIYIILCFLILLAGGLTLLYFYPDL